MSTKTKTISFEVWLSGGYVVIALLWIFASDNFFRLFIADDIYQLSSVQTIKGSGFVLVTGFLLWLLMRQKRRELEDYAQALRVFNQQLMDDIAQRKRAQRELELMTKHLEERVAEGMQEERQHLARDLHDAVTQTMFSASMVAEALLVLWERKPEQVPDGLRQLQYLTRGAIADMRMLLLELRPQAIEETRLPILLRQLCESYAGRYGVSPRLSIDEDIILPVPVRMTFYRIAQEALNNIHKHAKATTIDVSLKKQDARVVMRISDNGNGFILDSTSQGGHMGLKIMQERAQEINATFHIQSTPHIGTTIKLMWEEQS